MARKPRGYWTPERIDGAFDETREELCRIPHGNELKRKYKGIMYAIESGRYSPDVKNYYDYLEYRGFKTPKKRPSKRWTPGNFDRAFDSLRRELGRTPTMGEMKNRFGKDVHSFIYKKKYGEGIKNWNDYLIYRGRETLRKPHSFWNTETIDAGLERLKNKLGRVPTSHEFTNHCGGAIGAIRDGNYHPDIRTYNDLLIHKGLREPDWTKSPERIDRTFDNLTKKLGRIPLAKELPKGALGAILGKKYNPNVKNFTEYLKHRGFYDRWVDNPEKIDAAFDKMVKDLGRVPTYEEFNGIHGGAAAAITNGRYIAGITKWTEYLNHRGFPVKVNGVKSPEDVDDAFDSLMEELGRVPMRKEFENRFRDEMAFIIRGDYDPGVTNFTKYLKHRVLERARIKRKKPEPKWVAEKIDAAYDEVKNELGRAPKSCEFESVYRGALLAIRNGQYRGDIKSYDDYLRHRGDYDRWVDNPEKVDAAFDQVKKKLGRVPKRKDLPAGASHAILNGQYRPGIDNWHKYLEFRGETGKTKPRGYWTPERIRNSFELMKKRFGRVPTREEFEDECAGAVIAIGRGNYKPGVKNWGDFLKSMGEDFRWYGNPERVDKAFDELMEELGRVPTASEFKDRFKGAMHAIWNNKYREGITGFNDYLKYRGLYESGFREDPAKVDKVFDELMKALGRVPKKKDLNKRSRIAMRAISDGKYHPDVKNFTDYLKHRGLYGGWVDNPEKIDSAFDELIEELGRVPTHEEFAKRFAGAASAITSKRYKPDIKTYTDYLKHRGFYEERWTENPERIDKAFDELRKELGRVPKFKEFNKRFCGAMNAIALGKYRPDVKNYTDYLKHRGLYDAGWKSPGNIDAAFNTLMEELERVPTQQEFTKRFGGALIAIKRGDYHPNIKRWSDYLKHRGLYNGRIRSPAQFKDILNTEAKARYAVKLAHGNDADLADILVVVYAGRITREDAIQLMEEPSLRDYLGRFRPPNGISGIVKPVQNLLPLDKDNVIKRIMQKRLTAYRAEKLGPNPTDEQIEAFRKELEDELDKLGGLL